MLQYFYLHIMLGNEYTVHVKEFAKQPMVVE